MVTTGQRDQPGIYARERVGHKSCKTFRRHIVALGKTGLSFVYDELEADEPVTWDYLLHTVINPMTVTKGKNHVHIQATNKYGISDAYLFSSGELKTETTDQFLFRQSTGYRPTIKGNSKSIPIIGISKPVRTNNGNTVLQPSSAHMPNQRMRTKNSLSHKS